MSMLLYMSSRFFRNVAVSGLFVIAAAYQTAEAADGFYAGFSVGRESVDADYTKEVSIDVAPASYLKASDGADDGIHAFKVILGHRWSLSDRIYFSGEFDAALYADNRVSGFLEGTGLGARDVWPGAWTLEKHRDFGLSVKLGYMPATFNFSGKDISLYLLTGIKWLDATVETYFDNGVVSGKDSEDASENPWLVGVGMEFGNDKDHFDFRVQYADYDIDFGSGSGKALDTPRLDYKIEVEELGIYLTYTRALEFSVF